MKTKKPIKPANPKDPTERQMGPTKPVSFRAWPEVAAVLERAEAAGLSVTEIVNQALAECVERIATQKAKEAKEKVDGLFQLTA